MLRFTLYLRFTGLGSNPINPYTIDPFYKISLQTPNKIPTGGLFMRVECRVFRSCKAPHDEELCATILGPTEHRGGSGSSLN